MEAIVKKTKKKSEKIDFEKEKRKDRNTIIAIMAITAVVAGIFIVSYSINQSHSNSGEASVIDGIKCESIPSQPFHSSAHIDVIVDGKSQQVPAEIGIINNTCKYWIYTVDTTGTIHMDSPETTNFTLSQFFDIWKATDNLPPTGNSTTYINGQKASTNMEDIKIDPHDEIAIIYGNKPAIIPSSYQFQPSS